MRRSKYFVACVLVCAAASWPASGRSTASGDANHGARGSSQNQIDLAQRSCPQRAGPYATQDTAWQRWRQARGQGYAVSEGVFPCFESGARGYCFNVFVPC